MTLLRLLGLLVLFLITGVSCEDHDSASLPPPGHGEAGAPATTVASLELTPGELSIAAGTSADVQATLLASDGTTADVTSDATWTSSAPEVATVEGGTVAGLKVGTAEITVTSSDLSATLTVTVTDAALVTLSITPPRPTLAKGLEKQLTATGVFTDNTTQNLTKQVTWTSATKVVATISSKGLLTAAAVGSTKITAKLGSTSATTVATVSAAVVDSVALTLPAASLPKGTTEALRATATLSDGTMQDVTSQVDWVSSDESVATVDASSGVVTAVAVGQATISGSINGVTGSTTVTISAASLVSIGVTPAALSTVKGLSKQFTATGTYSDATVLDLTSQVSWTVGDVAVATISNATGSHGLASTTGVGATSISARLNAVTGSTTITVSAATLVSIDVTPATPSTAKGLSQQFTATGNYTDATTQDLTAIVTWASSDTETASISNAAGSRGLAFGARAGTASISATLEGISGSTTITVSGATLVSIGVTPASLSTVKGLTQQFTATGIYTDTTTQNLTAVATWASSDTSKASISNATGSQGLALATGVGSTSISATLDGVTSATTLTVTNATLVSIGVTPATSSIAKGLTRQFTATGTYTDATTQDLTTAATWASGNTGAASISNAAGSHGLASSVGVGLTSISATLNGVSSATTLTVTSATLVSIDVTPATSSIAKGLTRQFTATGTYTDASTQDLTTAATWASSNTEAASISNAAGSQGFASSGVVGSTSISATFNGVTGSTTLTVTSATLVSIGVTPATPSLAKGLSQQFSATGIYTDATTQDLTTTATWASSNTEAASISNASGSQGFASSGEVGSTSISATFNGVTGSTSLTVTSATLVSINVTPATPSLAKGLSQQFTAIGSYTDATTQDLTTIVTWASSNTETASISNASGSQGFVSSGEVGSTSISASFDGVTGSTSLTVTSATLVSIGVTPATPSLAKGLSQQFTATGTYTDATTQDLTANVTWASSDPTKASISNADGSQGFASSEQAGSTSISASFNGVTGSTTLTVTSATLVSIGVTPATPSIAKGLSLQFTAIGSYTDATTQDLTASATWVSSAPTKASISNAAGSQGFASTTNVGPTSISASLNGVTGSTILTVTSATLVSIGVTPATPSVAKGLSRQFTATGSYTDASTQDLTASATWASSDPTKASISNADGSQGFASSAAVGSTSISATFSGVTGSTTLTVTSATLVSIGVTPAAPSLAKGLSQQFTAIGSYTDATTQDLTATATWASSNTEAASISNAAGSQGFASAAFVGATTISAALNGVSGSTTLTVTAATLVSIGVTPATPSVAKGLTRQFTAIGTYTDASTQILTTTATWASSDPTKASISNAPLSQGLASAANVGATTISAALNGVTGSTTLTVTAATLVSIGVTPATPSVAKGLTRQFTAIGTYTDASTQILTTTATWASGETDTASISNAVGSQGLASAANVGATTISAALNGVTGSTTLTVSAATLVSIGVTPASPSIAKGQSLQFTATGVYTDASTQNLTTAATWASSDTTKASISNAAGSQGLASSTSAAPAFFAAPSIPSQPGVGPTSISATLNGISGSTTLTVTAATLVSIAVTPTNASVVNGLTRQFTAVGTYTDASTLNLTAAATWASSDPTKASVSNASGSQGLASSAGVGSTTISATFSGVTGSTTLTVTAATLVSIAVTPTAPSLAKGLTQQFMATGTFTNATTQDLTTTTTWASSDPTKASISNAAGSQGLASSAGVGATTISATSNGVTGSTTLTVTAATLVSIAVTPAAPSVAKGLTQQFTAVGTYTDTSTQTLTTATWASSDTTKASISNAAGSRGLASTAAVGPTSISASFSGVTGSTTLTVSVATLVSIAVTPANPGVTVSTTQQFTATGTYTDASTLALTASVTWASSNVAAATISNTAGSNGLATGGTTLGLSTTISATSGTTVGSTTLYIGRHDILAWTGYNTFDYGCTIEGSTGIPFGDYEWLTIPNLTWKACLLEASKRGAQLLSPTGGPWPAQGWFAARAPASTRVMIGQWPSYISDDLANPRNCNLVRDRQSGATNNAPLANQTVYDGDTWKYQDFGIMYLDQCEKFASASGASIITPWTIGLANGDNYWLGQIHVCSAFAWSASSGTGFGTEITGDRASQRACMVGYIL